MLCGKKSGLMFFVVLFVFLGFVSFSSAVIETGYATITNGGVLTDTYQTFSFPGSVTPKNITFTVEKINGLSADTRCNIWYKKSTSTAATVVSFNVASLSKTISTSNSWSGISLSAVSTNCPNNVKVTSISFTYENPKPCNGVCSTTAVPNGVKQIDYVKYCYFGGDCYTCPNGKASDTSCNAPPATPINGVCGTSLNTCNHGTLNDIADDSNNYLWRCLGSNGGTTASCYSVKGGSSNSEKEYKVGVIGYFDSSQLPINTNLPAYLVDLFPLGLFPSGNVGERFNITSLKINASSPSPCAVYLAAWDGGSIARTETFVISQGSNTLTSNSVSRIGGSFAPYLDIMPNETGCDLEVFKKLDIKSISLFGNQIRDFPTNSGLGAAHEITNCFSLFGANNATMALPIVPIFPASCDFRGNCPARLESFGNTEGFNLIWIYNYEDGSKKQLCGLNGENKIDSNVVKATGTSYNFNVSINDSNQKRISSVDLYISAYSGSNRSSFVKKTLSNINYNCNNECSLLGENYSIESTSDPTDYTICIRKENSYCFKNSIAQYCSPAYVFSSVEGKCMPTGGTNNCIEINSNDYFCNTSYITLTNSVLASSRSCGIPGIECRKCDTGYGFDSTLGYCVSNSCKSTTTESNLLCTLNNGVCSNSGDVNHAVLNDTFECCNDDFTCYPCNEGYHPYKGVCVSNNCSGGVEPVGFNFTKGANNTNSSLVNMSWKYVTGVAGACEWNCSAGYELNTSTNNSCQLEVIIDPTDCEANGKIFNGIECVAPITTCVNGCVFKQGNTNICVREATRRKKGNILYFCDVENNIFKESYADDSLCSSSFECSSNLCFNGTCTNLLDQVNLVRRLLIQMTCWARTGFSFSSAEYTSCINDDASAYLNEQES